MGFLEYLLLISLLILDRTVVFVGTGSFSGEFDVGFVC